MDKKKILIRTAIMAFLGLILALGVIYVVRERRLVWAKAEKPLMIAHGGGAIPEGARLDCLEALDQNYTRGFRTFELDFNLTSDHEVVVMHDWEKANKMLFQSNKRPTLAQFSTSTMRGGLTPLTIDRLHTWLEAHPDASVIMDIKENGKEIIPKTLAKYPDLKDRIIPQIVNYAQYKQAKKLDYSRIVVGLYRMKGTDAEIIKFITKNKVWGVSMWDTRVSPEFSRSIRGTGAYVIAHIINDPKDARMMAQKGANAIYTDYLDPYDPFSMGRNVERKRRVKVKKGEDNTHET